MPIHLYTSSDYLKDGATMWTNNWSARNWKTKDGKNVKHRDLWQALMELSREYQVQWHVVDSRHLPEEMTQAKKLAGMAASSG
jgi:ribonuclease HI